MPLMQRSSDRSEGNGRPSRMVGFEVQLESLSMQTGAGNQWQCCVEIRTVSIMGSLAWFDVESPVKPMNVPYF